MRHCVLLFVVCLAFIFIGSQHAYGQSGRRTAAVPVPTPSPSVLLTTNDRATDDEKPRTIKPAKGSAVPSILVAGEVVHKYAYYSSNDLDLALKECVNRLSAAPKRADATRIGKLDYGEAKERAKQQTDSYILWISFITSVDGLGNMVIDYADYAILMPKTGTRLTSGRVKPDQRSVVATGGVLGLPPSRRSRSSSIAARLEMREIARQIPDILVRGGWFGR